MICVFYLQVLTHSTFLDKVGQIRVSLLLYHDSILCKMHAWIEMIPHLSTQIYWILFPFYGLEIDCFVIINTYVSCVNHTRKNKRLRPDYEFIIQCDLFLHVKNTSLMKILLVLLSFMATKCSWLKQDAMGKSNSIETHFVI